MNEAEAWQPPEMLWTSSYTRTGPRREKFSLRKDGELLRPCLAGGSLRIGDLLAPWPLAAIRMCM